MPPLAVDGTELSQEMQAMKFEWTPQLKEILAQGPKIHPYIGPGYERGNPVYQEYKPGMPLPDPADPSMFLQWCGLNDETIRKLSDNFFEEKKDLIAQTPNRGYISKWIPAGWHKIHFPVLEGLVDTYVRSLGKLDFDFEESYEGFVKKAMQLGLKPEFAIFCGYHEDDWRAKKDPEWFLKQAPPDFVQDFVMEYSLILMRLIKRKLMDEGKVRHDEEYGYVIIEDEQQEATEQTRPEAPEAEAEHIEQKTAEQEE